MAYWQDYPPTHVLVAAYLLGDTRRSKRTVGEDEFAELSHAVTLAGGSPTKRLPEAYRQR